MLDNDKREGEGKEHTLNGEIQFDGTWTNDRRLIGCLFNKNGFIQYDGEWNEHNKKDGKGTKYDFSGNVERTGDWKDDVMEGKGTEFWPGKERKLKYVGTWKNNLKDGKGTLYYENSNFQYKGCFKDDKFEGYGQYFQDNGVIYYDGWFKSEKPGGKGKLYDKFGMIKYEGDFAEGRKNGFGIEYDKYSHNKLFEGYYKENLRHGIGAELWANGTIKYKGEWAKGMRQGRGIEYDYDGNKQFEGKWLKNERGHKTILFNFLPGDSPTIQSKKEIKIDKANQLRNGMKLFELDYNNWSKKEVDMQGVNTNSEMQGVRGKSSEINIMSPRKPNKNVVIDFDDDEARFSPISVKVEKKAVLDKYADSNLRQQMFYSSMIRE